MAWLVLNHNVLSHKTPSQTSLKHFTTRLINTRLALSTCTFSDVKKRVHHKTLCQESCFNFETFSDSISSVTPAFFLLIVLKKEFNIRHCSRSLALISILSVSIFHRPHLLFLLCLTETRKLKEIATRLLLNTSKDFQDPNA